MNPVRATALYVSASRAVLQCDPRQPHTFTDMYRMLPFFRQSLACLVCGELLQDPISPTHPECQHHVCLGCKGKKMQLKPSCGRCKDSSGFQENKQLSLLVQCYRKLCLYVTHSPLLQLISSHAGGSPEVMALLEEMLLLSKEKNTDSVSAHDDLTESAHESVTPTEASSAPTEVSTVPQNSLSEPPCFNGTAKCNGGSLEDFDPSSPELEVCELVEERPHSHTIGRPTPGTLTLTPKTTFPIRDEGTSTGELEEGEVLLLSVEEVLQTLDPVQPGRDSHHSERTCAHLASDRVHGPMFIQVDGAHNYTQIQTGRTNAGASHAAHLHTTSYNTAPPISTSPPVRSHRKRSRSESDREKVKPLPISSILHGPASTVYTPAPAHTPHSKLPATFLSAPTHTYSSLPNGGPPKSSRPMQHHSKASRKILEQNPKKSHAKARSGGSAKARDRSKEQRAMPGCLLPPAPVRPPYKKPVEKKGCKCGRATQNPSVLTCRGQRCPCYSNRKACLDCICRGCQNSYMANGEKKLEAFAVPEKALEQTRLTLGINLTSIAAAAALRGPTASNIRTNTLLNVATATGAPVTTAYLSTSSPEDTSFEESLNLLIG